MNEPQIAGKYLGKNAIAVVLVEGAVWEHERGRWFRETVPLMSSAWRGAMSTPGIVKNFIEDIG